MLKVVKIVNKRRTYVSKTDGKERPSTQLYLSIPKFTSTGEIKEKLIAIKPKFEESYARDIYELESVAEIRIIEADDAATQKAASKETKE